LFFFFVRSQPGDVWKPPPLHCRPLSRLRLSSAQPFFAVFCSSFSFLPSWAFTADLRSAPYSSCSAPSYPLAAVLFPRSNFHFVVQAFSLLVRALACTATRSLLSAICAHFFPAVGTYLALSQSLALPPPPYGFGVLAFLIFL